MSTEHTHEAIEAFIGKEKSEEWYNEHQDLVQNLRTLLKHISEDGETFTPPAVSTEKQNNTTVYLKSPDPAELDSVAQNLNEEYGGGEIVIAEGEHPGRWYLDWDNITLRGRSKGAALKLPDGTDEPAQTLTLSGSHCHVHTLTIDGNRDAQSGLDPDELDDSDGIGVYGRHNLIENIHVKKALSHGIIVWGAGSDRSWMRGVNVEVGSGPRTGNKIRTCTVEDTGSDGNARAAIDLAYGASECFVSDCTVLGGPYTATIATSHTAHDSVFKGNIGANTSQGYDIHSDSSGIVVEENIGLSLSQHFVRVRNGTTAAKMSNNIGIDIGEIGLNVSESENVDFVNNYVEDTGNRLFQVGGGASDITFTSDRFVGGGWGQVLSDDAEVTLDNVTIDGGSGEGAFRVINGSDVLINGCRIFNSSSAGVVVVEDAGNVYGTGNVLTGGSEPIEKRGDTWNVDIGFFEPQDEPA